MAILTPYGYIKGRYPSEFQSIGPDGKYLCPHDPQHNTTGEDGFYNDSHFGGASGPQLISQGPVPSDFQTASTYGYTPAVRGWVATPTGYIQGSYHPAPLGDASSAAAMAVANATGPDMFTADYQRREEQRKNITFWLSVVTTAVVGGSALMAIYRGLKGLKQDRFIREALEKKLL